MERTLILHCNTLRNTKLLDLFEKVLGPADSLEWDEVYVDVKSFSSIALIVPLDMEYLDSYLWLFLDNHKQEFINKRVALLFITKDSKQIMAVNHVYEEIVACLSTCLVTKEYFVQDNRNQKEITRKLINVKRHLLDYSDMPRERLVEEVNNVLHSHNTCTLCTGVEHFLRATPIEYIYNEKNGCLYFLSEGGEKFANIAANSQVAVAIYKEFVGFDQLEGLQIEGTVEMVELFSTEYNENVISRGLTPKSLEKLPSRLNMFKVIPKRIYLLNADLKKAGYHARQVLDLTNY